MSVADTLRAAKRRIEEPEKWLQGCNIRGDAMCANRAIVHGRDAADEIAYEAANLLRDVIGNSIVVWNDAPERTHAEVLKAFDDAIALAEGDAHE